MKKLLIATDAFLPRWDGIARFLSEIIPRLSNHFRITVVAPDYKGKRVRIKGVKIVRIPLQKIKVGDYTPSIIDLRRIKGLVSTNDIIFVQSLGPIGAPAVYYGNKANKKIVAYMHSVDWELVSNSINRYKKAVHIFIRKFARYLYQRCSTIIVPSAEIRKILKEEGIKTRTRIVHVAADTGFFRPGTIKMAKKKLKLNQNSFVIGFVGRIGREKDLFTLKKAYLHLKRKYPNITLLIVGAGVREEMRKLRHKGIRMAGSKNNVLPYYQAMNVHVLPSLTETSSISTMEAMAAGLPVIATRVGFLKGYIKEGINGMLFRPGNADELAKKIELLINNRKLRKIMGKNARKTIEKRFSWEKSVISLRKTLNY